MRLSNFTLATLYFFIVQKLPIHVRVHTKLDDRWSGPYRIREIPEDSTSYRLEELDNTPLSTTCAGNRLKRFFSRVDLDNNRFEAHETIRVQDALKVEDESQPRGMDIGEELGEALRAGDAVDEQD